MDNSYSENTANSPGGPAFHIPPSLKVKYQRENSVSKTVKVHNLSRGGISFEDVVPLAINTPVQIVLELKDKKMKAEGVVSWSHEDKGSFVHGIKFTSLSPEAQEWFNTFVMDWAAEHLAENLDFSSLTVPVQSERRMFARLKIPLRIEVGFYPDTILLQTHIYDISEGGLCLISDFELKEGQHIFMKLWISNKKNISLTGTVKYCAKKVFQKKHVNFHGVEFHKDGQIKEVAKFLEAKQAEMVMIEMTLDEIISNTDFPKLP